jgi:hypothetical protein
MAGRDEGTGTSIEPRNNRARRRLAVTIIRRLQSFTQWWVRLNKPHTQKFGHSPRKTTMIVALARKLLIALWRMVTTGEVPQGVVLRQPT